MSGLFGGRDPFDDPFFSRPSGSLFRSSIFGSAAASAPMRAHRSKAPVIQELDSDSVQMLRDMDDNTGEGDKYGENRWANRNPHVEHPDDQTDDNNNVSKNSSKNVSCRTDHSKMGEDEGQRTAVSFQRVTYGGINGPYYTASTTRKTGGDGMMWEESQQADSTTGQATHRISRGIHDKGHSVTRKLNSDGKVDQKQTLHNLNEDELARFEEIWKGGADRLPAGWNAGLRGFNSFPNLGARGALTFRENFRRQADPQHGRSMQAHSAGGGPKKVVAVPIE